jgi:hypothetical protein
MASSYVWIIDVDHVSEPPEKSDVGRVWPMNADPSLKARLKAGEGTAFRMYDDDDELYYEGRLIYDENDDDVSLFEPLDDFGKGNAGCTRIDYENLATGKWEAL